MNTLYVNDLSISLINTLISTITKKKYKVIYHRSNRRLTSIYFYDAEVFNKARQYIERVK